MSRTNGRLTRELSVIPRWAILLAAVLLVACTVGIAFVMAHDRNPPPVALGLLLGLFLGSFLGFLLYFLMRSPVVGTCPACQAAVRAGTRFCPRCGGQLQAGCAGCGQALGGDEAYCVNCGRAVGA
jgi:xanthosine utilization system XapX-like protein